MQKRVLIFISLGVIILLFSLSFVSANWFSDAWNKITGRATYTKCSSDRDCSDLNCIAMPGRNTPKCNINTGQCYCGGVCGDDYCDSYENSSNTCEKDCQTNICSDGTEYGKCSSTKPKYCSISSTGSYILIDKCSSCGCPSDSTCQSDDSCVICILGNRESNKYCGDDKQWHIQKAANSQCSSDYECVSNNCENNKCQVECYDLYDPVCGADGKTYSNDCYAQKANVYIACEGECPCETKKCSDGTEYGKCSSIKPKYCESGILIDKCSSCDCPYGEICQDDGSCEIEEGYSESFETGFGGWTADYYLQCEFDKPPCSPLEWDITRSTEQAYDGIYSLRGYLNGDHDDGTIWVEHTFEASPNSNIDVEISFYLWSERYSEVNRWPVIAYVGLNNPEEELDFNIVGETNEVAGWKKYSYSTQLRTDSEGILWVAFGFGATWEIERTYYMDLVNIKIKETGEEVGIETIQCDTGCLDENNNCLPIGTRTSTQYCDIDKKLKNQLSGESLCNNNFECKTNFCLEGKCTEQGFFIKMLSWFRKLFGG